MTGTQQVERSASTLRALKQRFGFSAQVLADRTGLSLTQVEWRLRGTKPMSVGDLAVFADMFGVPAWLLLEDEDEAVRWVAEHRVRFDGPTTYHHRRHGRPDLHVSPSPCMPECPEWATVSPLFVATPLRAA